MPSASPSSLQHNFHPTFRKVSLSGAWVSCDTTPTFLSLGSITHRDISVITAITPTSSLRLPWQAFATKTHKSHLSAFNLDTDFEGNLLPKQHTSQAASKNSQIIAPTVPSTNYVFLQASSERGVDCTPSRVADSTSLGHLWDRRSVTSNPPRCSWAENLKQKHPLKLVERFRMDLFFIPSQQKKYDHESSNIFYSNSDIFEEFGPTKLPTSKLFFRFCLPCLVGSQRCSSKIFPAPLRPTMATVWPAPEWKSTRESDVEVSKKWSVKFQYNPNWKTPRNLAIVIQKNISNHWRSLKILLFVSCLTALFHCKAPTVKLRPRRTIASGRIG